MKKTIIILLCGLLMPFATAAQVTIEECVSKAEANYPAVKKHELLKSTRDVDLSEINRSWLPRIGIYGQGTVQNVVPAFPDALSGVLEQMGQSVSGLGKFQYKAGADVAQTVWDGGASKARREAVRIQEEVLQAALDVELYAVRSRVESVFFAILLMQEQIAQNEVTYTLLQDNLERLRKMYKNGIAMQSDVDMVEAQLLSVGQNLIKARSACEGYRSVLELFTGEILGDQTLIIPGAELPASGGCDRPELKLFAGRLASNEAAQRLTDVALMPKIGLFAQAYYGYPGMDYFKSMMSREISFNVMAGVKISWNIDSFYSRKNNRKRTELNALDIQTDRETFMFNTDIQTASRYKNINGLREVMKDDARIIALRSNVRHAAESQLENGIIDATALLSKISEETQACLNAKLHEIQLIQEIYNLKYILNR